VPDLLGVHSGSTQVHLRILLNCDAYGQRKPQKGIRAPTLNARSTIVQIGARMSPAGSTLSLYALPKDDFALAPALVTASIKGNYCGHTARH
jgi:hypothetical protein